MGITWEDLKHEKDVNIFVERITEGDKITNEEWEWAIDNVDVEADSIKAIILSNEEYTLQVKAILTKYVALDYWPKDVVDDYFNN